MNELLVRCKNQKDVRTVNKKYGNKWDENNLENVINHLNQKDSIDIRVRDGEIIGYCHSSYMTEDYPYLKVILASDLSSVTERSECSPKDSPKGSQSEFKVGDRVRVLKRKNALGTIRDIDSVGDIQIELDELKEADFKDPFPGTWCFKYDGYKDLEKIKDDPITTSYSKPITIDTESIQRVMNTMHQQMTENWKLMNFPIYGYKPFSLINPFSEPKATETKGTSMSIIKSIKTKLPTNDRILMKHGYLDEKGNRTSMYESELKSVAMQKLIDAEDTTAFRKELAEALKEDQD
jgi:hypothetical protein